MIYQIDCNFILVRYNRRMEPYNLKKKKYSVSDVSKQTGISPITLRAWQRRYGLVEPVITDEGQLLYSQLDIKKINQIVGYLERGVLVSKVHQLLEAQDISSEVYSKTDIWLCYRSGIVAAIQTFDQKKLNTIYNNIMSLYSLETITERLLVPLFNSLGIRWQVKYRGIVAEEHFFSNFIRIKLSAEFTKLSKKATGKKLLFACLPNEQHEFGLWLFGLYVMRKGYEVIYLGAQMPVMDIFIAAQRGQVEAIVLAGTINNKIKSKLQRAQEDVNCPVFWHGTLEATDQPPKIIQLDQDYSSSFETIKQQLAG